MFLPVPSLSQTLELWLLFWLILYSDLSSPPWRSKAFVGQLMDAPTLTSIICSDEIRARTMTPALHGMPCPTLPTDT